MARTCWPERAAEVIGVDANPEAYEHARLPLPPRQPELRRGLVEDFDRAGATPSSSCRRSSTSTSRAAARRGSRGSRRSPTSRPPTASPSRRPARRSPTTPGTCASTTPAEYRELLEPHFAGVEILGLFHARKLRAHELAIRAGWDRVHPATRLTKPFYDRFIPAIAARDFRLRADDLDKALDFVAICHAADRAAGDLAIVLHSPHALRRGLRDLSVRRGVAVRRRGALLPAGAGGRRAADDDRHPGARRPARGRRGGGADARVPAPPPARRGRARRRRGGGGASRRRRRRGRALRARDRAPGGAGRQRAARFQEAQSRAGSR